MLQANSFNTGNVLRLTQTIKNRLEGGTDNSKISSISSLKKSTIETMMRLNYKQLEFKKKFNFFMTEVPII